MKDTLMPPAHAANLVANRGNTFYGQMVATPSMGLRLFSGRFGLPKESNLSFSVILSTIFLWIHISLALYAHWSYFQRCVQHGPQRPNFWAILDNKVSKNSGLWSLYQKVFTDFTSVLLHMLIASTFSIVWNMGLWGPILGPFWAPK